MKNWISGSLILFFLTPLQATVLSDTAIENQEQDQSICVEQTVEQCMAKCESRGMADCENLCEENARNECMQAGE